MLTFTNSNHSYTIISAWMTDAECTIWNSSTCQTFNVDYSRETRKNVWEKDYHRRAILMGVVRQEVKRSAGRSGFMGSSSLASQAASWMQFFIEGGRGIWASGWLGLMAATCIDKTWQCTLYICTGNSILVIVPHTWYFDLLCCYILNTQCLIFCLPAVSIFFLLNAE